MQIFDGRPEVRASKKNGRQQQECTGLRARRKSDSIQLRYACGEETNKKKPKQSFQYTDVTVGISFSVKKIMALSITGHQAHFSGTAKLGKHNKTVFTADVDDLGLMGANDHFSIQLANGYSAGGTLVTGDITVH